MIWSPKLRQPLLIITEGEMPLRDFKWSNVDTQESPGSSSSNGFGFVITLSVDQSVRVFNIARNFAECLITLNHDH